jgi:hypothetical protein
MEKLKDVNHETGWPKKLRSNAHERILTDL